MAEFKGIVQIGYDDLVGIGSGPDGIYIEKGRGRTDLESGLTPDFDIKVGQFKRLISHKIPISLGKDGEGNTKYEAMTKRDLKCRYDQHRFVDQEDGGRHLSVYVGPTSWQELRQDYNSSLKEALRLRKLGAEKSKPDTGSYALAERRYFSCGLGACVMTYTKEGDVVVGVRKSDSYDGAIHGAAGWMKFDADIRKVHPVTDARRELEEELGITLEASSFTLLGLVAYPKTFEADFVFSVYSSKERAYFTSDAWKKADDAKEHNELVLLSTPEQIRRLLLEGKVPGSDDKRYDIISSTYYGLEQVANRWEKIAQDKKR